MPDNILVATKNDVNGAHQQVVNEFLDGTGEPVAVSAANPLPVLASVSTAGLATSSGQAAGNASLASIDEKLTNPLPVDTGLVQYTEGDIVAETTAVGDILMGRDLVSNFLTPIATDPDGVLMVNLFSLQADAVGQKVMAASLPVVIASDQSAIPISNTKIDSLVVTGGKLQVELPSGGSGLTDTELRATAVPVSGTVAVSNFPGTQAVSALALPLPTNAATSALQGTGNTSLGSIDTKLPSGLTMVGDRLKVEIPAGASGLTDAELRATPVPVSATSLPLPTGAATAANQQTNALTDAELRLTDVKITLDGEVVPVTGSFFQATQPISAVSLPLPTGAALEAGNLATIKTNTDKIPALGQALAAASVPIVLTAAQLSTLTPPAAIAGFNLEATQLLIKAKTDNIPAQGQALEAASTPVVLPATQISALTPPAAITGFATSAKQDLLLTELQLKADLTETQPVSLASVPSHPVTNAGTFATQATLAAETTKVIGTVNIAAAQSVNIGTALPAGTNNIGDVDVLTLPAISLGASSNNIGDVDVLSVPAEGVVSTANSSTTPLAVSGVFTGTSEDITNYSSITVNVFSDVASATDGLSMQQSINGTNWDNTDVYTVPAATGKTFGVQATAKFFRIVYTNGGTIQASFRLQTVFHKYAQRTSSIRPQDSRSNDNDFEEVLSYLMGFNGTTWDRLRSDTTYGLDVDITRDVPDVIGTGSLTALNQAVTLSSLNAMTSGYIQLSGTWVGSIQLEGSLDNFVTSTTLSTTQSGGAAPSTNALTANGFYRVLGIVNHIQIRARCSAFTSGTIVTTLRASSANGIQPVISTNALGFLATVSGDVTHDAIDSGSPIKFGGYAKATAPTPVADADRVNAWFTPQGSLSVDPAKKATYRASTTAVLVPAVTSPNPWFIIEGSASKTIRIQRIIISGITLTAVAYINIGVRRYSTAASGGTSTTLTAVPLDSTSAAGTAVVKAYTAIPTAGTTVGDVDSVRVMGQATTAAAAGIPQVVDINFVPTNDGTAVVLRGTAQGLGLYFITAPATTISCLVRIEYTEE